MLVTVEMRLGTGETDSHVNNKSVCVCAGVCRVVRNACLGYSYVFGMHPSVTCVHITLRVNMYMPTCRKLQQACAHAPMHAVLRIEMYKRRHASNPIKA
jgi:hypothetical protein